MKQKAVEKIAVIGIGRVGLPLSLVLADSGFKVIGIDKDPRKHQILQKKLMPFKEEGAAELLKKHAGKNFTLGTLEDLRSCTTVIVSVGTFLSSAFTPDLSDVYAMLDEVLPFLKNNTLFVLRSTIHPNGTEKIYQYIKKNFKNKIQLVYAPERIAEGFSVKELYTLPQIIGSFDKKAAKKAAKIFKTFAPEIIHADPLTAELAKLVLNTYRYSKFALANELMMIVDYYGRDIHKVLEIANNNYKRGGIPSPGFAAGPCLVKDSFFLKFNTPFNTLITGSYAINDSVPEFIVKKLNAKKNLKNKKVAVLGLGFKKNIDDSRGSLSMQLIEILKQQKCTVAVHDPYLSNTSLHDVLLGSDVIIFATDHDEYKLKLSDLRKYVGKKSMVCDLWNILGMKKIFFELN